MKNISYDEALELFKKIRVDFLFNHPFLSVLALSIKSEFRKNSRSLFQTDGYKIDIDLERLSYYKKEEIVYLYAHTLLHIIFKHPSRRGVRELEIWNDACNIVINLIMSSLKDVGIKPDEEILEPELKDKCAEEVYEILYNKQKEQEEQSESSSGKDEAKIQTIPKEDGELESNKRDSREDIDLVDSDKSEQKSDMESLEGIIIQALSIAKKSGQYAGMAIEIDELIAPKINLAEILKEYLTTSLFEKESSYERPNKRYISSGIYMPGFKKRSEFIKVYIALDSSASIELDEYKRFLGVVKGVCESFYEYEVEIIPFDSEVKKDLIVSFDSFSPLLKDKDLSIPKSDGGTDFNKVLDYLFKRAIRADELLIVLSDGEFDINRATHSNMLFIISNKKSIKKFQKYGRVIEFRV